ncbi:MAG: 1-acyl-sn-glycerol-3-phosphate acyltransferase, partial [Cyanobacteria bacterium J06588_5]
FRPGAIQLPMSALAQLAKKAPTPADIPDFYVVPLSLKYRYRQPMQRVIEKTLKRLEDALNLKSSGLDDYQRLRQIGNQVILAIEAEAGLLDENDSGQKPLDWNERIDRLRQIFIEKCELALSIEPNLNLPIRERVYKVQATLESLEQAEPKTMTPEEIFWDAVRLLNFDAIYDGYVAEAPTPERFLDTLIRIEREVFHIEHAQPKAARRACFHVGEPLNLKDYLADYQRDRSGTVDRLAIQLHQTVQANLDSINKQT